MISSITVANEFLRLAKADGKSLTPMQVLKLVYIAHGWNLGLYHKPLIEDEVQAWKFGPVIPNLYNKISKYRSRPVSESINGGPVETLEPQVLNLIQQVYGIYGNKSGLALSRITHAANTPWSLTYSPNEFSITIPNDIIEDHYVKLAATSQ